MKILLAATLGVFCGLFSYLLDYCFWPGNVFKGYLPWLAMMQVRMHKPKIWEHIKGLRYYAGDASGWKEAVVAEAEGLFWYKVLGGCSVCLNVWIAMLSWAVICGLTFFSWYYGFCYVLVASWLIRKLVGATY